MLDTNILIYLIKNRPATVAERINRLRPEDGLCMSFVTYAELLKGAERSVRKADVLRQLAALLRLVPAQYQTDPALCAHYARLSTSLKAAGTPIGANDLWIACHALAQDCVLVTNNLREFQRIEGLRLENWARD
ncbi:MAG: type II toxin-antitoxin system VapC family toxin [Azoarcus sp.]|jgi:tRNA(fMet)-specific endonuclease VapC|nr:type II toxin-antitoxin system VapC family toxin [Azoarcus sp.]